jgi:hypothetical protein
MAKIRIKSVQFFIYVCADINSHGPVTYHEYKKQTQGQNKQRTSRTELIKVN